MLRLTSIALVLALHGCGESGPGGAVSTGSGGSGADDGDGMSDEASEAGPGEDDNDADGDSSADADDEDDGAGGSAGGASDDDEPAPWSGLSVIDYGDAAGGPAMDGIDDTFDPAGVYFAGRVPDGDSDQPCFANRAVADVMDASQELTGFGHGSNGMCAWVIQMTIRPTDGRLFYVIAYGNQELEEAEGTYAFYADGISSVDGETPYPQQPLDNDGMFPVVVCDNFDYSAWNRVHFSPSGHAYHHCSTMGWYDQSGEERTHFWSMYSGNYWLQGVAAPDDERSNEIGLAWDDDIGRLALSRTRGAAGVLVLDAIENPSSGRLAIRADSEGFDVVLLGPLFREAELWRVDLGGTAERMGSYPPLPEHLGYETERWSGVAVLDTEQRLYQVTPDSDSGAWLIVRRALGEEGYETLVDSDQDWMAPDADAFLFTGP